MRRSLSLHIVVLVFAAVHSHAQLAEPEHMLAGPYVSLEWMMERAALPESECGPLFTRGEGMMGRIGGAFVMPSLLGRRFGLRVGVDAGSEFMTYTVKVPTRSGEDLSGADVQLVEYDRERSLDVRRTVIGVNPTLILHAMDNLAFAFGPTVTVQLAASYVQREVIPDDVDFAFGDGSRERDLPVMAPRIGLDARIGAALHASHAFHLGSSLWIVPGITVRGDFLSRYREPEFGMLTAGANVGLLFDLNPPGLTPPPIVISEPLDPPRPPRRIPKLTASVAIHGIDEENRIVPVGSIEVNEVLFRQYAPLITTMFFEKDSVDVPARYVRRTRTEADRFVEDSLAGLNALEIQRHTLDIIGSRLRKHASARLILAGSASRDDAGVSGPDRAESLRSYLVNVWKINPSRVTVWDDGGTLQLSSEATADGRADNRRVEFMSNNPAILAPVVTNQIVRQFDPPAIKLDQHVEAEAGIKAWTLVVRQGDHILARYSSSDSAGAKPDLAWDIAGDAIDSGLAPLVAEFTVLDSADALVTVRDQVALNVDKKLTIVDRRVLRNGDHEMIGYTIVGFNFNSAELSARHNAAIADLAATVRRGARITVTGYTDRTGMEQRNAELSLERAERVAGALARRVDSRRIPGVAIEASGAGVENVRFGSMVPEARALSRGVYVVVEQTVE